VIRTFADRWTGTGTISGSGDAEQFTLAAGQYMESETWELGAMNAKIVLNKYGSGTGTPTVKYKTGASAVACEADSWHTYDGSSFACAGFAKIKVMRSGDFPVETFDNLDNWTEIGPASGRYVATGGQLVVTTNASNQHTGLVYNTPCGGQKQYVKFQVASINLSSSYMCFRAILRRTGVSGEKFYNVGAERVAAGDDRNNAKWAYSTDDADMQPASDIDDTLAYLQNVDNGDWIGVEIGATGSDTVVNVWCWASDPGAYDEAYTNWGTPDDTSLVDPGSYACDTGLYLGIFVFGVGSGDSVTIDNWSGGWRDE
jgi:hypothetical protein